VIRAGLGWDLHRLAKGRAFLLGGVEIPSDMGELGHSDGDVLTHAVIDAILGAAALGDIGEFYPPQDPAWKDAASLTLLRSAWKKVLAAGWRLANLDCVVICEQPRILPFREAIRASLAAALDADPAAVFVKGKTREGLEYSGGPVVEALASALLETKGLRDL
jgi:2-C-methyl-D-erythritol 2,4-cyclodiphosphate synthase